MSEPKTDFQIACERLRNFICRSEQKSAQAFLGDLSIVLLAAEQLPALAAALVERDQRIAELTAMLNDEIGDRDKCCQCRFDIDDEYTPIKVCEYHQRMQERANELIAELERERDQLDVATHHLSADLKAANLTIKAMGERCDKLAGLLRKHGIEESEVGE